MVLTEDARGIIFEADRDHIRFNTKTMDVFWLIGFSGWKAIECYSPHVILSVPCGESVAELISHDSGIAEVERDYRERRAAAQTLINAADAATAPWPPDIPRPSAQRDALDDRQYQVAFDLCCVATAFCLFHEFRHVMLDFDGDRPPDRRVEEMACDIWGREFITAKLETYAKAKNREYHEVLRLRSMGIAIAALVLHEITPELAHGGTCEYFSIADRLRTLLENTPLPEDDHFWVLSASLLIGIFRQRGVKITAPPMSPQELAHYLIDRL